MSLKNLASLMKSALSTVESADSTVGKKKSGAGKRASSRSVRRSGVTREEISKIVQEEVRKAVEELKRSIIEEIKKEVSQVQVDVEEVVERVLERLREEKSRLQRERHRIYPIYDISDTEAKAFLPWIEEFSNSKKKFRGSPKCFVPSEFHRWLLERGIEFDLPYIRAVLKKLHLMGYLEKSSMSRYRLVRREGD